MSFTTEGIKGNLGVKNLVGAQVCLDHMHSFQGHCAKYEGRICFLFQTDICCGICLFLREVFLRKNCSSFEFRNSRFESQFRIKKLYILYIIVQDVSKNKLSFAELSIRRSFWRLVRNTCDFLGKFS